MLEGIENIESTSRAKDVAVLAMRLLVEVAGDPPPIAFGKEVVLDLEQLQQLAEHAWTMGANVVRNTARRRRTCRICGCWELEACEGGCSWVGPDLCSACE